jgi:hypothetical protein
MKVSTSRLEFDQQVHVAIPAANTPHDVTRTRSQVIADVTVTHAFQRVEINLGKPRSADERFHQLTHHPRMREQQLVRMIVIAHGAILVRKGIAWKCGEAIGTGEGGKVSRMWPTGPAPLLVSSCRNRRVARRGRAHGRPRRLEVAGHGPRWCEGSCYRPQWLTCSSPDPI